MRDETGDIRDFYNASAEKEDRRLERHQLERDMTWRYLDKYLPRQGKILEIGAGTGAYTILLARRGYRVTAVDFAAELLDKCRQKAKEEKLEDKVTCLTADARDLAVVIAADFDAALMMGPLYHLVLEEDRRQALQEAYRRLKSGGVIFSTLISRYGIWNDIMQRFPDYVEYQPYMKSLLTQGTEGLPAERKGAFRGYFAATREIAPLHEAIGFKTLALAGIETAGVRDEMYNPLRGKRRELWLDFLFAISAEESIVGASNHILYAGVKE
ncbi:MAG: class I SAM-dependent methyltransferase [Dehalococcoidales bacterium]|jgi:ubiquinone/menaquinone biosynthesis C-methylase UbiE